MSAQRTVEEKLEDWAAAYLAIRDTLTPEAFRVVTNLAQNTGDDESVMSVQSINIGMAAARIVFANDRAAATVAALLTANGVKPVGFDFGDES